ncbi:993_t:CDS:2, partial [Entrophospora sp. SA101]
QRKKKKSQPLTSLNDSFGEFSNTTMHRTEVSGDELNDSEKTIKEGVLLYPRRVGWETSIEQNGRQYYTCITEGNEN